MLPYTNRPASFGRWTANSPQRSANNHADCALLSRKDGYLMRDDDCFARANDNVNNIVPICQVWAPHFCYTMLLLQ